MDYKVLFFVVAAWAATPEFGLWEWDGRLWSETKPTNCPSTTTETHVCRDLHTENITCITVKCCHDFAASEKHFVYGSNVEYNDDNSTQYHVIYNYTDNTCNLCASIRECVMYNCNERCCDGYVLDVYELCKTRK